MVGSKRRAAIAFISLASVIIAGAIMPTAASAATCTSSTLAIVAHEDDDLYFMNPDIQKDLAAGRCTTTVFLTAGDAGMGSAYWRERELGPQSAYSTMLGLPQGGWSQGTGTYNGHIVRTATTSDATATLVYLRLPDGGFQGGGYTSTGGGSLTKLWGGAVQSVRSLDFSAVYTKSDLIATLASVIAAANPSTVRVQSAGPDSADHADHLATGLFSLEALAGSTRPITSYQGYGVTLRPANVSGADLALKSAALQSYKAHDPLVCGGAAVCTDAALSRQYTVPLQTPAPTPVPGPAPYSGPNVARNASVIASSGSATQPAVKAIDGVVDGYPGDYTAEWATVGQGAGAWIQLSWASAQQLDRVYLYDRPNGNDQITAGTLTFSDGSTVTVPALNNGGGATIITFPARSTTTLRLTVTTVSGSTGNVGLAELEAYNGNPTPTPPPTPTPVPGPAPYSGPNVARNASVIASSGSATQPAVKAIDSVVDGYPGDYTAEWATVGQGAGAWIQLSWASAQQLDRVYLYDRPNGNDQITAGTLTFSDGSTVTVPALNNGGGATIITFPARSTTTLRLTVTTVSGSTGNVGLAELEAYNGNPTPTPPPTPTPVPGPAPYSGPNVARNASVIASSGSATQPAVKAIDSVVDGYPGDYTAEWATVGQGAGAWIQLSWASAQQLDRVYLYDRPNGNDQITAGTLTFSDGSTVTVPALNNGGGATIITFPARSTTTLRLTVTTVSGSTGNVGLAELEAYNGNPTPTPPPSIGPNVARNASVIASSGSATQPAVKAIDGVVDGYPGDYTAEWATVGQGAGAWIQLSWASAQQLDRVYLYDRPNGNDQITAGTLTFSDGSTVTVPALNNGGGATIITFPARSTTTLRLTVTTVSGSTGNVGLAELEAYNATS